MTNDQQAEQDQVFAGIKEVADYTLQVVMEGGGLPQSGIPIPADRREEIQRALSAVHPVMFASPENFAGVLTFLAAVGAAYPRIIIMLAAVASQGARIMETGDSYSPVSVPESKFVKE